MSQNNDTTAPTVLPQVREVLSRAYPELSAAIAIVGDAVCDEHLRKIRQEIASAAPLPDDLALDDLKLVLDTLAKALGQMNSLGTLALLGPAHAAARDGQSFTLQEVLGEYVLLRRSLHAHVVSFFGRPLSLDELDALQSGIDCIATSMVTSFIGQREARLRLENTALSHFLTSLAHDLRNEINGVLLSMQLVEEGAGDLPSLTNGNAANRDARLDSLLRDVTASRRIMESTVGAMTRLLEAEKLRNQVELHPREVDLAALMEGIARSAARAHQPGEDTHRQKCYDRLRIDCPSDLKIFTDPELLGAVLVNLVGNAFKYAPTGTILIKATRLAGGRCRIQVQDTGPGISPDGLERLFEKFDRAGRQGGEGLGLGLFIARRAADLLGGRISVESELGRGSCFTVELAATPGTVR